jgi:hypothetical protein
VVEHGADGDESAHRVPDEHAVVHVEVLQDGGDVGRHGLGSDPVGAERGAPVATLIERDDAKAPGLQFIPHKIPLEDPRGVAVHENHRRSLARNQRVQHRPIWSGDQDMLTLRFGGKPFAWKRIRVPPDPRGNRPGGAPAQHAGRSERRGARPQPCSHRWPP